MMDEWDMVWLGLNLLLVTAVCAVCAMHAIA